MLQCGAWDVNDAGQVVGWSSSNGTIRHAFLYRPGSGMIDLGTLNGGQWTEAYGINNSGAVVGQSGTAGVSSRAFLYTAQSGMVDLNTLAPGSGWRLQTAKAINDSVLGNVEKLLA
jgi:probable HAF family extracellular repeat protein